MARRPRPVNPADGPVQAFAHDLRLLREQAGNPTYRVLAERAGFAATTLSDAAGGVRLPSLEVTQAFVGACGGNVEEWTRRWNELDRRAAAPAADPEPDPATTAPTAGPEPDPAADPPATDLALDPGPAADPTATGSDPDPATTAPATGPEPDPVPAPPAAPTAVPVAALPPLHPHPHPPTDTVHSGPRPPRRTAVGKAVLLVLTAVLALVAAQQAGLGRSRTGAQNAQNALAAPASGTNAAPSAGGSVGCPAPTAASPTALFTGTTYNGTTRLRAGASLSADVLFQVPAGCQLPITGFCLGDVVIDATSGSPDVRWFRVSTGGYVSSAVIHGNPPAGLQPTDCPDAVPSPASIALAVAPHADGPGHYELRATGDHLGIVGYAAYLPRPGSSTLQWQQIGMSSDAPAGFLVPWQPALPAAPADDAAPQAPIRMVAVACFGGDGASTVTDQRLLSAPVAGPLPVAELGEDELTRARKTACRYPDAKHG